MKKIIWALFLMTTASASASTFTEMFQGKPEKLEARCAEGEKDALVAKPDMSSKDLRVFAAALGEYNTYLKTLSQDRTFTLSVPKASPAVWLQTRYGNAFNICRAAAVALEKRPSPSLSAVSIYANGLVNEVSEARAWKAVLLFRDSSGAEIARFTPDRSFVGDLNDWKATCSPTPCRFAGTNTYIFLYSPEIAKVAERASSMVFLTSFGRYGIKEYPVNAEQIAEAFTK